MPSQLAYPCTPQSKRLLSGGLNIFVNRGFAQRVLQGGDVIYLTYVMKMKTGQMWDNSSRLA